MLAQSQVVKSGVSASTKLQNILCSRQVNINMAKAYPQSVSIKVCINIM